MKAKFPKVLFVNDFAPDALAVADLVRQLFSGYPTERIAWWHWRAPRLGTVADFRAGRAYRWPLPNKLIPTRRFAGLKSTILERVCVPLAARHLRQTIRIEKPDVVWVLLFAWPILVARHARLNEGPPLHVSLWDMPDTVDFRRTLGERRARSFMDAVYDLIRHARTCDGISKGVLNEITQRTGRKDGLLVHSGFDRAHLEALEKSDSNTTGKELRVAYVGTIISEKSFMAVLGALDKVRATLSQPLKLEFFGGRGYRSRAWFNPKWMLEHPVLSDGGLVDSLKGCSWGVVVMDLDAEDPRYSQFSFPNKIGTYLSAGVPVLGFAHADATLAQVMKDNRVGAFTSAKDPNGLQNFLRQNLELPQPRALFRDNLLKCARTEFDAEAVRRRLWSAWGATGFSDGQR